MSYFWRLVSDQQINNSLHMSTGPQRPRLTWVEEFYQNKQGSQNGKQTIKINLTPSHAKWHQPVSKKLPPGLLGYVAFCFVFLKVCRKEEGCWWRWLSVFLGSHLQATLTGLPK